MRFVQLDEIAGTKSKLYSIPPPFLFLLGSNCVFWMESDSYECVCKISFNILPFIREPFMML